MKNKLLLLVLSIFCASSLCAQESVDSYYNGYFNQTYDVLAYMESNTLNVIFEVAGQSISDEVYFRFDNEKGLQSFCASLLLAKDKYVEWVNVAKANNITEMTKEMGVSFKNICVCWYGSEWWFDFSEKISPIFLITDTGKYVCLISGEATASSNEYIDQKYYLALSSEEDFDNLYAALQPQKIKDALNNKQKTEDLFQ